MTRTPGPWDAKDSRVYGPERLVAVMQGGDYASDEEVLSMSDPEVLSNAKFVASAPDMEQALKAIRKDVIAEHGRVMPSRILQMQAALNKAKGETE